MLENIMIFVLWCHTVGNVPKRNCSFVGKMLHSPALILYHYKSSSISCTSTAGWLLIFSLYPSLSHTSPTHSSASTSSSLFSPIFAHPPHIFLPIHLPLLLHLPLSSLYPFPFSSSFSRQVITKPCVYPGGIYCRGMEGGREV